MEFKNSIMQLTSRIKSLKSEIQTEEATKTAFIMPFIQSLGYDVFNPLEVIPEFTCDIGTKKGEKVDYAIMQGGKPIILIECKHWGQDLNLHDNQLLRYFNVSNANFGLLTNGIIYRFYADLKEKNKMDEKPFFEINLEEPKDYEIKELKKFHKSFFDLDSIFNTANELKYQNELRVVINEEFNNPTPEFARYFARQVYDGVVSQKKLEEFIPLVKKSISTYMSDLLTTRIQSMLQPTIKVDDIDNDSVDGDDCQAVDSGIITTQEELDGFNIIKAILYDVVDIERVVYRDAKSYFAVLFDDNNRKPICRLYFNSENKKYIATFDDDKKEIKNEIFGLNDIYKYSSHLRTIVGSYINS